MSVTVISQWDSGMTAETYKKFTDAMKFSDSLPKGCEAHTAAIAEDGTFIVTDIWESAKAFETFSSDTAPTLKTLDIKSPDKVSVMEIVAHAADAKSFRLGGHSFRLSR